MNLLFVCAVILKTDLNHDRFSFIWTAGRWSWKSSAARECVTTHRSNEGDLKMEVAEVFGRVQAKFRGERLISGAAR